MSLSGFELMLAIGTSAYVYDLRNLDGPLQSKDSKVNSRIRCIRSASTFRGIVGEVPSALSICISSTSGHFQHISVQLFMQDLQSDP